MRHGKSKANTYMDGHNAFQLVKEKVDLVELVEDIGDVDMSKVNANIWNCECPHPDHDDEDPSFFVYHNADGSWSWHCYGCGGGSYDPEHGNYGNDCFAFIQWMAHRQDPSKSKDISSKKALEILAKRVGIKLPKNVGKFKQEYRFMIAQAKAYHASLNTPARKYLYSRGLEDSDIKRWNLGVHTFTELDVRKFRRENVKEYLEVPRITFPITDMYDQVVAFSNRTLIKDIEPKYKIGSMINDENRELWKTEGKTEGNSFQKRHYLYGENLVDRSDKEILLVEGQMDVILGKKYSDKNIVGVFGHSVSQEQIGLLKRLGMDTVCLCFDGDKAGEEGLRDNAKTLAMAGFNVKILRNLPEGRDIADMARRLKQGLDTYLQANMVPFWQYALEEALTEYQAGLSDLKRKLIPQLKKVAEVPFAEEDDIVFKSFVTERFGIYL